MNNKLIGIITASAIVIGGGVCLRECKYVPKERKDRIEKYSGILRLNPVYVEDAKPIDTDDDGVDDRIWVRDIDGKETYYLMRE